MRNRIRFLENISGFSLVEIMIALGLGAIVALGVMQYFAETFRATRKAQTLVTAEDLKLKVETLIRDRQSSGASAILATVNGAANNTVMGCWRNYDVAPGCITESTAAAQPFTLYNASGTIEVYSITTSGNESRGFTSKGEPCSTFDDTNGDANCVFGFELNWKPASCPPGCVKPPFLFNAILHYRPLRVQDRGLVDSQKYSMINFVRSVSSRTKSFQVFAKESPSGTGGGSCTDLATPVNRVWTAVTTADDPFGMITLNNTRDTMTLAYPGTYNCTLMSKAFGVGAFNISLLLSGASVGVGSGYAPPTLDGTATLEVTFNALAADTLRVTQNCQDGSTVGTNGLGRPVASTTQSTFASLLCFVEN